MAIISKTKGNEVKQEGESKLIGVINTDESSALDLTIMDSSKSVSNSLLNLNFEFPLELLLDISMLEVDETYESHLFSAINLLNDNLCSELLNTSNSDMNSSSINRIRDFADHLSKRLFQRVMGASNVLYIRALFIVEILLGLHPFPTITSSDKTPSNMVMNSLTIPPLNTEVNMNIQPTVYAKYIIEAINNTIGSIGNLNLNILKIGQYGIYERLHQFCELLVDGIITIVKYENLKTRSPPLFERQSNQSNQQLMISRNSTFQSSSFEITATSINQHSTWNNQIEGINNSQYFGNNNYLYESQHDIQVAQDQVQKAQETTYHQSIEIWAMTVLGKYLDNESNVVLS